MSEHTDLTIDEAKLEPREDLDSLRNRAWIVGGIASLVVAGGYLAADDKADFYRPYLIGWLFCLGVAMGLSGINMINHLSGGYWGLAMRRVLEASGRTLPFFLLLFLPIFFGLEDIYPWAEPGVTEHDELIAHKAKYLLNPFSYKLYSILILVIWSTLAYVLSFLSHRHDETGDESDKIRMQRVSSLGLILYVLTGTIASVLWIMSVDPHWFSSLFGLIFVVGHAISAFAFAVPALLFLSKRKPFQDRLPPKLIVKLFHDYGKLMLAFVSLWAYFMMSQFLIIWSGNLPEEVTWYLDRASYGWKPISVLLVVGHFVLPFIVLLSQDLKKNAGRLIWVACWLLAMRWFDLYWQITPSVSRHAVAFNWLDPVVPIAIGGLWLGLLLWQLKNRALLPIHEPALKEVIAHG